MRWTSALSNPVDRLCCRCGRTFREDRPSLVGILGVALLIPCWISLGVSGIFFYQGMEGGDTFDGLIGSLVSVVFAAVFACVYIGILIRNIYRLVVAVRCPACSSRHTAILDPQALAESGLPATGTTRAQPADRGSF